MRALTARPDSVVIPQTEDIGVPLTAAAVEERESDALPVIEFVAPLPGFPTERRFVLVRVDEHGLLYALTSVDKPDLRFLVMPPGPFFPEYAPVIDDETLAELAVTDPENLLVLLVVSTSDNAKSATANLMAPIVLDQSTRRAVQVVMAGGAGFAVRAPLLIAT